MRRFWYRLAGFGVPLLVLSQLALPSFLADRLESRLTEDGGTAEAQLSAFPALRLLAGHGDRLYIRASGLSLEEPREERPFDRLDKFDDVAVLIERSRAGPFRVRSFFLDRVSDKRYRVYSSVTTSAAEIGRYAGDRLGGPLAGGLASVAAAALSAGGAREIPAQLRATVDTSGEMPRTIDAQADVGGLPAGPLALILTDALLARL